MSKRCICEICTCGRHRCPHRPTNHMGQGAGPCSLTEYNTTYKQHPIPLRESFRPDHKPMQGGEFHDQTTQRQDYHAHPLERPYVHQPEQYNKPQGNMDGQTSYNKDYTEKHGAPAQAIRNEGQRMIPAKFSGEPTYRSDYQKWDGARQPAYGQQAAWHPPTSKFEGQTTFQNDFKRNPIPARVSFKPNEGPRISDQPFEDKTSHRDAYIQHAMPKKFQREREAYKPSGAQFDGQTTFKRDYKGGFGEPTHSFKPEGRPYQSDAPFEDGTTNRNDYRRWAMERPYVHAQEIYQKPEGNMETCTTHNATYKEMPLARQHAVRPISAKKTSAPFDGQTNYNHDFKQWQAERTHAHKQPDYIPNQAPFEGNSTYKGHYVQHPAHKTAAFRPDNGPYRSDAKFEDGTMYRTDYVPKEIQICEAGIIDQPTSRFRFTELDSRGHKMYAQTTVSPLKTRSPMQSQQRLAMGVA